MCRSDLSTGVQCRTVLIKVKSVSWEGGSWSNFGEPLSRTDVVEGDAKWGEMDSMI